MLKVFLTGGSGRLGRHVSSCLVDAGCEVIALCREGSTTPRGCVRLNGDLFSFDHVKIKGCSWAVHLAGTADFSADDPHLYRINVEGTRSVLEHCSLAHVKNFLHISSISVYGKRNNPNITESTPLHPDTPYSKSKYMGEMLTKNFEGNVCILRPSIIYGEGFYTGFDLAYRMVRGGTVVQFGDGRNCVPLVHAGDVARMVLACIQRRAGGIYNVNDDLNAMPQSELLNYVASLSNPKAKLMRIPLFAAKPLLTAYNAVRGLRGKRSIPAEFVDMLATDRFVSADKARRELGFECSIPLREGVRDFVQLLSENYGAGRNGKN